EKTGTYFPAPFDLAKAYMAQGNIQRAIFVMTEAIGREPANYYAFLIRGQAWFARGNLEAATTDFDETLKITNHVIGEAMTLNAGYTYTYIYRGHAYAAKGQVAEAMADYKKSLELEPHHLEAQTAREYISQHDESRH